jgi:hypothetical protein
MCYEEGFLKRLSTKRVRERAVHADRTSERPTPSVQPERKKPEGEKPLVPERELEPV